MISVVIPVYNDPKGLKQTLESMSNQNLNNDEFEVIVVDNNSDDNTDRVIADFTGRNSNFIGLEENKIQSSYAARNKGIRYSNGDIICFIDADMWADPSYLSRVRDFFRKNEQINYIGCKVEMVRTSNSLTSLYNKKKGFPVAAYIREKNFAPTCCLSLRTDLFEKTGYFKSCLISGGDKDFGLRVAESGFDMQYVPEITIYHPTRNQISEISKKYFRIGRGKYQKQLTSEGQRRNEEKKITLIRVIKNVVWDFKSIFRYSKNVSSLKIKFFFDFMEFAKDVSMTSGYCYQSLKSNNNLKD